MIRGRAREEIRRILEAADYEVDEGNEQFDLTAIRDDEAIVVLCSDDTAEIEEFARRNYKLQTDTGTEICKKILFTLNDTAKSGEYMRWGYKELAKLAGEASIAYILDRELVLGMKAQPVAKKPKPVSGPELPHLPLIISEDKARRIAGIEGSAKCRFLPHWFYTVTSKGEKVYNNHVINFDARETGAISAINGLKSEFEETVLEHSCVPGDSEVLSPKVPKKETEDAVVAELVEKLTKVLRISKSEGDAISYTDKTIRPDRDNITIDMKLVYTPVWQIRGNRIVEVNAYNGEILCAPMDDGAELI